MNRKREKEKLYRVYTIYYNNIQKKGEQFCLGFLLEFDHIDQVPKAVIQKLQYLKSKFQ